MIRKTGHESRSICKLNNAELSNVNIICSSQPDPLICDLQKRTVKKRYRKIVPRIRRNKNTILKHL